MRKWSTFHRLLLLVLILLIPNVYLYNYANKVSERVITDQLQDAQLNQLIYFSKQIETNLDQLSLYANSLFNDPSVQLLLSLNATNQTYYSVVDTIRAVDQKMKLQTAVSGWMSEMSLYLPSSKVMVQSNDYMKSMENPYSLRNPSSRWTFHQVENQAWFVRDFVEPAYMADQAELAKGILQVRFPVEYMRFILESANEKNQNDPFLFQREQSNLMISRDISNETRTMLAEQMQGFLGQHSDHSSGSRTLSVGKERYLISYVYVKPLDWYLIDYKPLEIVFAPIAENKEIFYFSIAALLIFAVVSLFYIYKNIQIPIARLVAGVQSLKRGDYSVRVDEARNNEFMYLFERFNQMAQEIETLVGTVLEERIRSREATVKQLQSQINPHFLYNCLAFIKSMARLNRNERIIEMCLHLGSYYRYATRNEKQVVTLEEELELIRNYLSIQDLKHQRIEFDIQVPEEMKHLQVPRLLLQPVVENSIIHGIEQIDGAGKIMITGSVQQNSYRITVEDNGPGLTEEKRNALMLKLTSPMTDEVGCGIWNVHHRLQYNYSGESGLHIRPSSMGGLAVSLVWVKERKATGS